MQRLSMAADGLAAQPMCISRNVNVCHQWHMGMAGLKANESLNIQWRCNGVIILMSANMDRYQ
jgi:hypothetical protein